MKRNFICDLKIPPAMFLPFIENPGIQTFPNSPIRRKKGLLSIRKPEMKRELKAYTQHISLY